MKQNIAEKPARERPHLPGLQVTPSMIDSFIEDMRQRGHVQGTLDKYRRNLNSLFEFMGPDTVADNTTLERWRDSLAAHGYAVRTVNTRVYVANSFFSFLQRRDLQLLDLATPDDEQPELTRAEYLRLLQAAHRLGKERLYLAIKLFATTGIPLQFLPELTIASVRAGVLEIKDGGETLTIRFPDFLQREFLEYAARVQLGEGAVFVTHSGRPMSRTYVTDSIRAICAAADVPIEKGNPRCLIKLYRQTISDITASVEELIRRTHDQMLEAEQLYIGWKETGGAETAVPPRRGRKRKTPVPLSQKGK